MNIKFKQVDMLKMEPFIDSLVEGLGLDQGYTAIVVNPKWSSSLSSYGFRAGFSADEVNMLREQARTCGAKGGGDAGALWGRQGAPAPCGGGRADKVNMLREQARPSRLGRGRLVAERGRGGALGAARGAGAPWRG